MTTWPWRRRASNRHAPCAEARRWSCPWSCMWPPEGLPDALGQEAGSLAEVDAGVSREVAPSGLRHRADEEHLREGIGQLDDVSGPGMRVHPGQEEFHAGRLGGGDGRRVGGEEARVGGGVD